MTGHSAPPEFHIVVRRPSRHGPLAPFRFAASVIVALVVASGPLREGLTTGTLDDSVLVRAIEAAVFTWLVLTVLNRVLRSGPEPADAAESVPADRGH